MQISLIFGQIIGNY